MKHFQWLILFSTNDWLWNVLYPGMKHFVYVLYVGFDAQRNLCDKQIFLFYVTPVFTRSQAHFRPYRHGPSVATREKYSREFFLDMGTTS